MRATEGEGTAERGRSRHLLREDLRKEGHMAAITTTDTPVTDLVAGQTFRQVRMGREERHLSVVGVRRVNGTHDYMVVSYLHDGRQGEIHLRVGTTVEVVAN
jgi:hypothetical protein